MFGPLYGQLIGTTVRVVGWNVWGLYGPWEAREAAIITTLAEARADIVVLAESWAKSEVKGLLSDVYASQDDRSPLIVCGDFIADPGSDEMRMMTGRAAAPVQGVSFYDAWEVAGQGGEGCTLQHHGAAELTTPSPRR